MNNRITVHNVKGNVKITQAMVKSNNIIKVVPVKNDFTTKKSERDMFIKFCSSKNEQFEILQFMNDNTIDFQLKDKNIFIEKAKVDTNGNEIQFGAGSTYKKEKAPRFKKSGFQDDSFFMTLSKTDYKTKQTIKRRLKALPVDVNKNSRYLILIRDSHDTFKAHPVDIWHRMIPNNDVKTEISYNPDQIELNCEKLLSKYRKAPEVQEPNSLLNGDLDDENLSETEMMEKETLKNRKKNDYFMKLRYGNKERYDKEESDQGDHENDEIDYMSTDSSMNEELLDDHQRELLYSTVDIDEETVNADKAVGKESENNEEFFNEKSYDEKLDNEKPVNNNKQKESEEEDDDDDDDDDDDSDEDSDDYFDPDNYSQSYSTETKRTRPADSDNQNTKRRKVDSNGPVMSVEARRVTLKAEMRRILVQRGRVMIKTLFNHVVKKNYLDPNERVLFFEIAQELNVKREDFLGEKYFLWS